MTEAGAGKLQELKYPPWSGPCPCMVTRPPLNLSAADGGDKSRTPLSPVTALPGTPQGPFQVTIRTATTLGILSENVSTLDGSVPGHPQGHSQHLSVAS